jgi:hypothetical protein
MSPGRDVSFEGKKGKAKATTKTKMVTVGVALVQHTETWGGLCINEPGRQPGA